jgi:hypothetical protein
MAKGKYADWLTPEGLLKIEGWARDGLIDKQIAENIGISERTFTEWKTRFSALSSVLKKEKDVADRHVENALYERAIGGIHKLNKAFKVKRIYYDEKNRKCEKEEIVTAQDEVYVPGDTTAQIFWLKNRKPDKWRDKQEIEDKAALGKLDEILKGVKENAFSK